MSFVHNIRDVTIVVQNVLLGPAGDLEWLVETTTAF
jgi:hypothetical protein